METEITSNFKEDDLAFTILWSPLPLITWIIPFIGHMGITNSNGIASDFQGPYNVGDRGRMAFGPPTRALRIAPDNISASVWDESVQEANREYRGRMHNICCDNCHSHVAYALNRMNSKAYGIRNWDMGKLCFLVFFRARFLSFRGFLQQFIYFGLLITGIVVYKHYTQE